jgi:uncharacterized phage protein gp47/JayE
MAAPTLQELYDIFKAEAQLRRPDLTYQVGDISEMMSFGSAAVGDRIIGHAAELVRDTFIDGATGDALTTLVDDHGNIQRNSGSFATGTVTFTRSVTAAAVTIDAGTHVATSKTAAQNEVQFTTDSDLTLGIGVASGSVTVTAVDIGTAFNVAATLVNRIIDPLDEDGFTVSNAAVTAGGSAQETDEALRERFRNSLVARGGPGTLQGLETGALSVSGVAFATAVEDATGLVFIYVTDASGGSTAPMVANVTSELESNWAAAGAAWSVVGGALSTQPITLSVTARVGVDTNALTDQIKDAVTARCAKLKIGETLYRSMIRSAVMAVDPNNIQEVTVTVPATDVAPSANNVIRAGVVTVS